MFTSQTSLTFNLGRTSIVRLHKFYRGWNPLFRPSDLVWAYVWYSSRKLPCRPIPERGMGDRTPETRMSSTSLRGVVPNVTWRCRQERDVFDTYSKGKMSILSPRDSRSHWVCNSGTNFTVWVGLGRRAKRDQSLLNASTGTYRLLRRKNPYVLLWGYRRVVG